MAQAPAQPPIADPHVRLSLRPIKSLADPCCHASSARRTRHDKRCDCCQKLCSRCFHARFPFLGLCCFFSTFLAAGEGIATSAEMVAWRNYAEDLAEFKSRNLLLTCSS